MPPHDVLALPGSASRKDNPDEPRGDRISRMQWLALVVLVIAVMSSVSLAVRPLVPVDETRYVSVAWEMWRTGSWFVPQLNGVAYDHKPPLLFWLIHLGWALFGVTEWWPRVIAPLCVLLAVFGLDRLSNRLWPDRPAAGRLGTLIFLTSFYISLSLTAVMFDMLLLACIAWGWVALHRAVTQRDWGGWLAYGLAMGLGILAKGPVALIYLIPPLLLSRWWAPVLRTRSPGYMSASALIVAAAVPLAWLLAASETGSFDYIGKLVVDQTVNRVNGEMGHPRPWYWYVPLLFLLPMPWSLWPPAWRTLRQISVMWNDRSSRFAIGTLLVVLVLLSLVAGKQVHYLIPALAMGSLVLGRSLCEQHETSARTVLPPAFLMGSVGLIVLLLAKQDVLSSAGEVRVLPLWAMLLFGVIAASLIASRPRSVPAAVRAMTLAALAFSVVSLSGVFSTIAPRYDLARAAKFIHQQQTLGRDVAYVGNYQGEFTFLGRLQRPLAPLKPVEVPVWLQLHPNGLVVSRLKRVDPEADLKVEFSQPYKTDRLLMYQHKESVANGSKRSDEAIGGPDIFQTWQDADRRSTQRPARADGDDLGDSENENEKTTVKRASG